ncbi:GNAT family N-acetyltransferase [Agrobacterium rhizogenes]|nr:GNAT family N-acetyltransferase [Rhizobium rhizogenes]NTH36128.1 GNAT family N-acetyltransferase [Rhizobium rhizogenes]
MGYSLVPKGKLANAVTCLEMTEKPAPREANFIPGLSLERMEAPDLVTYRQLFRLVGEDWMWVSRLVMSDQKLTAIINDPLVEIYVLLADGRPAGMLELDFRQHGQCELVFFGVAKSSIGTGAGRYLMDKALSIAWAHPIERLWVHTCHFDHPNALPFYQRSGFKPYAFMVEVTDDPRLTGVLPRTAAPHIPILG